MSTKKFTNPHIAWAYLSRVIEGPHPSIGVLLEFHSPEEIAEAVYHRKEWIGTALLRSTASRYDWYQPEEDLEAAEKIGARLLIPGDPEWPAARLERAFSYAHNELNPYARTKNQDAFSPHALWIKGKKLDRLLSQSIAVVGTRAITKYGEQSLDVFIPDLVRNNWTIISGGAIGIDAYAHRLAMHNQGETIAVLGCGIDQAYPKLHARLFEEISYKGAIISEYAPGILPARHRFLTRNRLIAALSDGVLVIEAAYRSGALSTLAWGNTLGCVTMAAPGPVHNSAFLGCHSKIQSGDAQLVVNGQDARLLMKSQSDFSQYDQESLFPPNLTQQLSLNELRVFDALTTVGLDTKTLAQEAGLSTSLTMNILLDLLERGYVSRVDNKWAKKGTCNEEKIELK